MAHYTPKLKSPKIKRGPGGLATSKRGTSNTRALKVSREAERASRKSSSKKGK